LTGSLASTDWVFLPSLRVRLLRGASPSSDDIFNDASFLTIGEKAIVDRDPVKVNGLCRGVVKDCAHCMHKSARAMMDVDNIFIILVL
jgi:hypothetical protein